MKSEKRVWKDQSGKYESIPTVWAGMGEKRKRGHRILPKEKGYFVHVTSRTTGRMFLFGPEEKRVFVGMMRQWAEFSELAVLTHCLMDNHFHVLLWVPAKVEMEHEGLREKLELVWPLKKVEAWELAYQVQKKEVRASMDAAVLERMGDLPEFMRVLKQSFTCWYNRLHERSGTLWDSRYRSVVVDRKPLALLTVAAYIELNPLRAGLVADPMAYEFSGYGSAILGNMDAREGIQALIRLSRGMEPKALFSYRVNQIRKADRSATWSEISDEVKEDQIAKNLPKSWKEVQAAYRLWLVAKADKGAGAERKRDRKGMDPAQVVEAYENRGAIPIIKALQMKMKSFTAGVAVGSSGFLEELMAEYPENFSEKRKQAGIKVKGMSEGFESLRQVDS